MPKKETKTVSHSKDSTESEFIKRFKANPLIFIGTIFILVIVVVAFVLVPAFVPEAMGRQADLTFGRYNKKPINYVPNNYFAQVYANYVRYYQSIGQEITDSDNFQIWRQAFEEAVVHTAILDTMEEIGYKAPPPVVDRRVAELPQFQENGRFSSALYRSMDDTSRLSLWREVQDSIAEEHYRSDLGGLRVSNRETEFIGLMSSPVRSFDMVTFFLAGYPDSEVKAYGDANVDKFRVTHLSRITVTSGEREAAGILRTIQEGNSTFEDAAREHSTDNYADKGGDMGIKLAWELDTEAPEAADRETLLKLERGAYSGVIKTGEKSWSFFRAEEECRRADTDDSSILQKIRSYIDIFERSRIEDWTIAEADRFIADIGEDGFDAAAEKWGLEKDQFGPLPVNYGDVGLFTSLSSFSVENLSGASSNENFWKIAFSTPLQTASRPLSLGSRIVVLYPLEEKAADETNTGYIQEAYKSYWMSSITNQNIRSFFMSSDKLEDDFILTYSQLFLSGSGN
ncbi:MAG: SurA N-terminal domain-containing protein [Treponema sp.]|jgi:hypothetical protein|nr:SurA N-terminal domain-containing protein [Treponema sp.]